MVSGTLGAVTYSFSADGIKVVVERNGYYPFGSETALGSSYPKLLDNRMKFNGKEVQTTGNLGLLDYGARMYDPAIGRWTAQDPLSEKYYSFSAYNYCVNNPVMFVDLDGRDWYSYEQIVLDEDNHQFHFVTMYAWTTATSQEELDATGIEGSYLGEAIVEVNGYYNERIGSNGTLTDDDAICASITIYGINGPNDIKSYPGLSMSSDPSKYSAIENGDYMMYHEQMATSPYGKGSLTYRIATQDKKVELAPLGGRNKANGESIMTGIFFHRTNLDGVAINSSKGCINIDGRYWREVESQLKKSKNILMRIKRKTYEE